MLTHLIAQFAALATMRGQAVHHAHGDAGWVLWTQPRHGVSCSLAEIHGHLVAWSGRRN